MNKVILGIIALIVVASGAFVLLGSDDSETSEVSSTTPTIQTTQQDSAAQTESTEAQTADSSMANYVTYSDEKLEESAGTKRVVFFHANWCSTCNFFEGQIEKEGVPTDITILKADYDKDTELKEKYGVTIQSTFVLLDESGNVVKTWPFASGLRGAQDLYEAVREA